MSNGGTNPAFANPYVFIIVSMPVKLDPPLVFLWYDNLGSMIRFCCWEDELDSGIGTLNDDRSLSRSIGSWHGRRSKKIWKMC